MSFICSFRNCVQLYKYIRIRTSKFILALDAGRESPLSVVDRLCFLRVHVLVACVRPVPHVHTVCHCAGNRWQRYESSYTRISHRKEILNPRKQYPYIHIKFTRIVIHQCADSIVDDVRRRNCTRRRSASARAGQLPEHVRTPLARFSLHPLSLARPRHLLTCVSPCAQRTRLARVRRSRAYRRLTDAHLLPIPLPLPVLPIPVRVALNNAKQPVGCIVYCTVLNFTFFVARL